MTKWEYLLLISKITVGGDEKPWIINGHGLRGWDKGPDLLDYINQLGDEGWDLVTEYKEAVGVRGYWFKRPKS